MTYNNDYYTKLPGGNYLVISNSALEKMHKYQQIQSFQHESGGILVGSLHCGNISSISPQKPPHIYIRDVTTPLPLDKSNRTAFLRTDPKHLKAVDKCTSLLYLGEWHTHPEPNPSPSSTDLREAKAKFNGKTGLLIIIGLKSDWVAYWDGSQALELPRLVEDTL